MTDRTIKNIKPLRNDHQGDGFETWDMNEPAGAHDIDPFILVSLFEMSAPYILPESPIGFINQDSIGTRNRIEPGAIHMTVAGSGAVHEEQPERSARSRKASRSGSTWPTGTGTSLRQPSR